MGVDRHARDKIFVSVEMFLKFPNHHNISNEDRRSFRSDSVQAAISFMYQRLIDLCYLAISNPIQRI